MFSNRARHRQSRVKVLLATFALLAFLPTLRADSVVVFNELHYHPEGDNTALEYIEFYNQLAVDVDLSNWRIDGDVTFDFPEGTVIGARDYLVVAADPVALATQTGSSGSLGPFTGSLSNSGNPIVLYNNNRAFNTLTADPAQIGVSNEELAGRRIMDLLDFEDTYPWPTGPDGSGFTLAKTDPSTGTAQPANWSVSTTADGTPGAANVTAPAGLIFNEISGSQDASFRVEIHNPTTSSVSLAGLVVTSSDPLHPPYALPAGTLAPGGFLTIDAATLGFTPADNNRLFLLSGNGSTFVDAVRADDILQARNSELEGRWLSPSAETFGAPNTFDIPSDIVINEIFYQAPIKSPTGGTSSTNNAVQVIDFDSTWRYNLDAGNAGLPSGWATVPHAADGTSWDEGPGLLGVENATLGEPLLTTTTLNSGQITYYFETDFVYNGTAQIDDMRIEHYLDDGAIFYLNGTEIGRFNLAPGAVTPLTRASPGVGEASLNAFIVANPPLLSGTNRLSVEVHQASGNSSDVVLGTKVTINEATGAGTPGQPHQVRDEEWLELFNKGTAAIDLTDWKLSSGIDFDFPAGTTIPAGGYLVIADDPAALAAKHPTITILGDYGGKLGNGSDHIILEDPNGNPADEVRYYDSGKWHARADGGGSSLELQDPDSDNRVAGAWAPSEEAQPSAWQTITYSDIATEDNIGLDLWHELQIGLLEAGEFLIDDISVIENNSTEFIQNGDFEGDTPGGTANKWRTIGTHGSHGKTTVITDPDDPGNQCLRVVATGPTENKHNKLETTFANSQEVVLGNTYTISFRAKYISGSNQLNTRLYFNYLQRTHLLDTPEIWGTPGAQNSTAITNAGPSLQGLSATPVAPAANAPVTVSANASDADGVASMTLHYAVEHGAFQTRSMSPGTDGTYTGTVPGQATAAHVQFYISATDSAGATSFLPAAGPESGAFYRVQDGAADTTGLRHNFRILMAEDDRIFLHQETNVMSNDRVPATVIEDETTAYYDVAIRLKASAANRNSNSNRGYNIRFQPDQPFRGVHGSIAIERGADRRELLVKHINNRAANLYTSSYDDVARVIPPSPSGTGVALLHMARNTNQFFDSYHDGDASEGTVYNLELHYSPTTSSGGAEGLKVPRPSSHTKGRYDLLDRGDTKEPYRWGFQIRSARARDDYARIIAVNQAFELSGDALANALDPLIDIDQWMRTFALMTLNGTDDTYGRLHEHNFRYYVRPGDQRVCIMQWDLDRAFRNSTSISLTPTNNREGTPLQLAKLYTIPRFERLFHGHIDDLAKTTYNSAYLSPWISHFGSVGSANHSGYLTYINNRVNYALGQLPATLPFAITTNGGANFSESSSSIELEGNAWVDVFTIQVNGIETPITWTGGDTWQIATPIPVGATPLTLTAYNHHGAQVGSDTITVTNTSPVDLANATNTIISELHYHPADPSAAENAAGFTDADLFEFVELTNTGTTEIDLTNVAFTDGITFSFHPPPPLSPPASASSSSPIKPPSNSATAPAPPLIAGTYTGNLRNSGESVRLEAADTSPIADFTYGESSPWPDAADGAGYSLVFTGDDPTDPLDWRSSATLGGDPGAGSSTPYTGGDLIDYALASPTLVTEVGDSEFLLSAHVNLAAEGVSLEMQFATDLDTWTSASGEDLVSRVNHGDGTATWIFRTRLPTVENQRQFVRIKMSLQP